jgi:hypothetical protein
MKLLLGLLVLAFVVALVAAVLRRGARHSGYRRRFENVYRRDSAADTGPQSPLFIAGLGDGGAYHPSHGHGGVDCGAHGGHADGGASGCGGH